VRLHSGGSLHGAAWTAVWEGTVTDGMSGSTQSHQVSGTGPGARIPLDGTLNTRDIGGWPVDSGTGGHVRYRVIYRSDTLDRLSPRDVGHFVRAGVQTVIDLRAEDERHGAGHLAGGLAPAGATVHSFPLYDRVSAGTLFVPTAEGISHPLEAFYRAILVRHADAIRSVIEILADPANLPAMVHCTAGKDRTGMVVALLLSVAGVDDETIVNDYALTGANLTEEWMESRRGDAARYGMTWEALKPALETAPEAMRVTLAHVRAEFGSAADYLVSIGVPPESVSRIRANLTATPPA